MSAKRDITFAEFEQRVQDWLWHYSSLKWGNIRSLVRRYYQTNPDAHKVAVLIMSTDGQEPNGTN